MKTDTDRDMNRDMDWDTGNPKSIPPLVQTFPCVPPPPLERPNFPLWPHLEKRFSAGPTPS
jgi:hypothetical protein